MYKILILIFYIQKIFTDGMNVLPSAQSTMKIIKFKFFITPLAEAQFFSDGKNIEDLVNYVSAELERAINLFLERSDRPMTISFQPSFIKEIPPNITLDKCDESLIELTNMLNNFLNDSSDTSIIAMLSCSPTPYAHVFDVVGQEVPVVTQYISALCSTRSFIFLETEQIKFLSAFATALMRTAGVNVLNPLKFEESTNGDEGVRYEIHVDNKAMEQLAENRCFYNH